MKAGELVESYWRLLGGSWLGVHLRLFLVVVVLVVKVATRPQPLPWRFLPLRRVVGYETDCMLANC